MAIKQRDQLRAIKLLEKHNVDPSQLKFDEKTHVRTNQYGDLGLVFVFGKQTITDMTKNLLRECGYEPKIQIPMFDQGDVSISKTTGEDTGEVIGTRGRYYLVRCTNPQLNGPDGFAEYSFNEFEEQNFPYIGGGRQWDARPLLKT